MSSYSHASYNIFIIVQLLAVYSKLVQYREIMHKSKAMAQLWW